MKDQPAMLCTYVSHLCVICNQTQATEKVANIELHSQYSQP